ALYFLRIRRPTRIVPALHLWPDQIRDRQANVPWQKLRFSWLLLLQLLVAAFLVAAAVQPALPASASLAPHNIVLLDASASMQAKDVQPSRLEDAKRQISAMIDQLGPQDRMTLIAMQSTPRIVASGSADHDSMHRALSGVAASNGPADLSAALSLAAGVVRAGEESRGHLFSYWIGAPLYSAFANGLPFPVLLAPPGNVFLEQALRLRTDFQVHVAAPASYRGAAAYPMTVFDRFSPPALPDAPYIVVDPPAGTPLAGGAAVGIGRVRASD